MLRRKDDLSELFNGLKASLARYADGAGAPSPPHAVDAASAALARDRARVLLGAMKDLDGELAPYLYDEGHTFNKHWGYLTRAGHDDKSHIARQIEKYADVYCAKVTNLDAYTPFHHFRAAPVDLAHTMAAVSSPDL